MGKSLGDYNIEQSSSHNIRNIIWTTKNQVDPEKSKNKKINSNKKFQISSASYCNIKQDFKRPGR